MALDSIRPFFSLVQCKCQYTSIPSRESLIQMELKGENYMKSYKDKKYEPPRMACKYRIKFREYKINPDGVIEDEYETNLPHEKDILNHFKKNWLTHQQYLVMKEMSDNASLRIDHMDAEVVKDSNQHLCVDISFWVHGHYLLTDSLIGEIYDGMDKWVCKDCKNLEHIHNITDEYQMKIVQA